MASRRSPGSLPTSEELFVDRQAELALISRRLEEARGGQGCFIAISGEPGIGKTRLAHAAAGAARKNGFGVFWGQCHDGQYIPPYWPWKQILRGLLDLLPSRSSHQGKAISTGLSEIVSDVGGSPADAKAGPKLIGDVVRLAILESVTALLRLASEARPLLLVLDNLHCADVPSLQLLQVVSREMSDRRIVIIGSHRESPVELGSALRETLGALAGESFFEGIRLSGWDPASVAECLGVCGFSNPPSQLVNAVHGRTEGNPLFVREVARLLQHEGLRDAGASPDAQPWETHIPPKVRLAILGLFERLTPPCREALAAAAIIGREFDVPLLREVLRGDADAMETLLEEALAHGLIEEMAEETGHYRFTHALVQDVVSQQTPGPRRQALHLKTAEALERRDGQESSRAHAGRLARHFDSSGAEHREKAIFYYRLAGERALRIGGYEDAYGQFSRAAELSRDSIPSLDSARLLFGLAQSEHGLGRLVTAAETHAQAFALFVQNGDTDSAVRIFEQPLILMEKPANLTGVLEKAISLVGAQSLRGEALGGKYALAVYHDTGDYARAASIFEKALRSARQSGDREQEVTALVNWGRVETDELHYARACELEEQALRIATEMGDLWLERMSRGSLSVALLGLGRLRDAERETELLYQSRKLQTRLWTQWTSFAACAAQRQKGELAGAAEVAQRMLTPEEAPYQAWNRVHMAIFHYETGGSERGAELLARIVAEADRAELPFHWEGWLTLLIAYIAWITGEPVPLPEAESAARKVPLFGGLRRGDAVTVSVGLALVAAIRNDPESAARHYRDLLPFSGLVVSPYEGLGADHILAILASTTGDAARAREHFESALAFCRANGLVVELAYTCRDYAEFLLRTEAKPQAERILDLCREAVPIADQSGLVHLAKRLGQIQQAVTGQRHYPDSLSEREVEVLRLLSGGLSNAQIADRLFISLHTVANHVQRILSKTGSDNRTEAAMYAVRHRLADE